MRRFRRGERGASAVEMALCTPFLAALLVGTIEIGGMHNAQQELTAAAREGARAGADPAVSDDEIIAAASAALDGETSTTITVSPDEPFPCEGHAGNTLTVTVSRPAQINLLFVGVNSFTQKAEASFQCIE
jgi:Flp pilus assembly protein TadG